MPTIQYPYPIATQISISKDRRIRLPKFLGVPIPFVLVESTRAEQLWLGICGNDSLPKLTAEYDSLRVVTEYRTCRPTIPKAVCDRYLLISQEGVSLIALDSWVEIWPGLVWESLQPSFASELGCNHELFGPQN